MADRNNIADQNRREAQFWASEWRYKQKKKKIIIAVAAVVCLAVLAAVIHFVSIKATRTTYSSEEEMKAALQGRFKGYYSEDIFIDGDKIRIVYYEKSHYDIEYARKYGYSEEAIMNGLEKWKGSDQWLKEDGQYIPYPATWLNKRRWEDPPEKREKPAPVPAKQVIAQQYEQRDYHDDMEEIMRQQNERIIARLRAEGRTDV